MHVVCYCHLDKTLIYLVINLKNTYLQIVNYNIECQMCTILFGGGFYLRHWIWEIIGHKMWIVQIPILNIMLQENYCIKLNQPLVQLNFPSTFYSIQIIIVKPNYFFLIVVGGFKFDFISS